MNKLKIAVQKSERISNDFLNLLSKCGIKTDGVSRKLYCNFVDFPIEIYFIRGNDIPDLMKEQFDVSVIGMDSFLEYKLENNADIIKELNFSKCHLSFAGRSSQKVWNIKDLSNKKIATTYKNILTEFLKKNNISADIVNMSGSVETSIELGFADYIFDIVQTGSTLMQQGLIELQPVIDLQAVMIKNKNFKNDILDNLLERIDAILLGQKYKYLMFNCKKDCIDEINAVLPSINSPTVLNLMDQDYVAIHTLCETNKIFEICNKIKKIGAEGIIVSDINLMFK